MRPDNQAGKPADTFTSGLDDLLDMLTADISTCYALVYIGRAACPVCKAYGPDLRRFATRSGLAISPLSGDGGRLSGWAKPCRAITGLKTPNRLVDRLLPLTALHNRRTGRVMLVGIGHLTSEELATRIHWLVRREAGDAF